MEISLHFNIMRGIGGPLKFVYESLFLDLDLVLGNVHHNELRAKGKEICEFIRVAVNWIGCGLFR
jgi:hypothetical protein